MRLLRRYLGSGYYNKKSAFLSVTIVILLVTMAYLPSVHQNDQKEVPHTSDYDEFIAQVAPDNSEFEKWTFLAYASEPGLDGEDFELYIFHMYDGSEYGKLVIVWKCPQTSLRAAVKHPGTIETEGIIFFLFDDSFDPLDLYPNSREDFLNIKDFYPDKYNNLEDLSIAHYITPKWQHEYYGYQELSLSSFPQDCRFLWYPFIQGEREEDTGGGLAASVTWKVLTGLILMAVIPFVSYGIACLLVTKGLIVAASKATAFFIITAVLEVTCNVLLNSLWETLTNNNNDPDGDDYLNIVNLGYYYGYGTFSRYRGNQVYDLEIEGVAGESNAGSPGEYLLDPVGPLDTYSNPIRITMTADCPKKVGFRLHSFDDPDVNTVTVSQMVQHLRDNEANGIIFSNDESTTWHSSVLTPDPGVHGVEFSTSKYKGESTFSWYVAPIFTTSDAQNPSVAFSKCDDQLQPYFRSKRDETDTDVNTPPIPDWENHRGEYDASVYFQFTVLIYANAQINKWDLLETSQDIYFYKMFAVFDSRYKSSVSDPYVNGGGETQDKLEVLKITPDPNSPEPPDEFHMDPSKYYYVNYIYNGIETQLAIGANLNFINNDAIAIDTAYDKYQRYIEEEGYNPSPVAGIKKGLENTKEEKLYVDDEGIIYINVNTECALIYIPYFYRNQLSSFLYSEDTDSSLDVDTKSNSIASVDDIKYQDNKFIIREGNPSGRNSVTINFLEIPSNGIKFVADRGNYDARYLLLLPPTSTTVINAQAFSELEDSFICVLDIVNFEEKLLNINSPDDCNNIHVKDVASYDGVQLELNSNFRDTCVRIEKNVAFSILVKSSISFYNPSNNDDILYIMLNQYGNFYNYQIYSTRISSSPRMVAYGSIFTTPLVTNTVITAKAQAANLDFTDDDDFPKLVIYEDTSDSVFVKMNIQGYRVRASGFIDRESNRYGLDLHNDGLFDDTYTISIFNSEEISNEYSISLSQTSISVDASDNKKVYLNVIPKEIIRSTQSDEMETLEFAEKKVSLSDSYVKIFIESDTMPEINDMYYCQLGDYYDLYKNSTVNLGNYSGQQIDTTQQYNNTCVIINGIVNISSTLKISNSTIIVFSDGEFNPDDPQIRVEADGTFEIFNSILYDFHGNRTEMHVDGELKIHGTSSINDLVIEMRNDFALKNDADVFISNTNIRFNQGIDGAFKFAVEQDSMATLADSLINSSNTFYYIISGGGITQNVLDYADDYKIKQASISCNKNVKVVPHGNNGCVEYTVRVDNTGDFTTLFTLSISQPSQDWDSSLSAYYAFLQPSEYIDITLTVESPNNAEEGYVEITEFIVEELDNNDYYNATIVKTIVKNYQQNTCIWSLPDDISITHEINETSEFRVRGIVHNNGSESATDVDIQVLVNGGPPEWTYNQFIGGFSEIDHLFSTSYNANDGWNMITLNIFLDNQFTCTTHRFVWADTKPSVVIEPDYTIGGATINITDILKVSAISTNDTDGNNLEFKWNMSNGDTLFGKSISYMYPSVGLYPVILTVYDDNGLNNILSFNVNVIANNRNPISLIYIGNVTYPSNYRHGFFINESIELLGNFSTDIDGDISNYSWEIVHNGTMNTTYCYDSVNYFSTVQNGTYNVTLTVKDNSNLTDSMMIQLLIQSDPIPLIIQSHTNATVNETVWFDGTDSYTIKGESISNYTWYISNISINYSQYLYSGNVSISFSTNVTYCILLSITDSRNISANTTTLIYILT